MGGMLVRYLFITDGQSFASFGSSALQHRSSRFACHAGAKAVFVHSLPFTGLKCSLHELALSQFDVEHKFNYFLLKNQELSLVEKRC